MTRLKRTARRRGTHGPAADTGTVTLRDGRSYIIRPVTMQDAPALRRAVNSVGREGRYLLLDRLTLEEVRAFLRQYRPGSRTGVYLVVVAAGPGRRTTIVGGSNIRIGRWPTNRHIGDLGIFITDGHRDAGLGTELMRAMLDAARRRGIRKIDLSVFATNRRAERLYRKLGFVEEGRRSDQYLVAGRAVDEILFGLWIGRRRGAGRRRKWTPRAKKARTFI